MYLQIQGPSDNDFARQVVDQVDWSLATGAMARIKNTSSMSDATCAKEKMAGLSFASSHLPAIAV